MSWSSNLFEILPPIERALQDKFCEKYNIEENTFNRAVIDGDYESLKIVCSALIEEITDDIPSSFHKSIFLNALYWANQNFIICKDRYLLPPEFILLSIQMFYPSSINEAVHSKKINEFIKLFSSLSASYGLEHNNQSIIQRALKGVGAIEEETDCRKRIREILKKPFRESDEYMQSDKILLSRLNHLIAYFQEAPAKQAFTSLLNKNSDFQGQYWVSTNFDFYAFYKYYQK